MLKPQFTPVVTNYSNPTITLDRDGIPISFYDNDTWNFAHSISNKNVSKSRAIIDFNVAMSNDMKLTESQNKTWLRGIKEYLYVRNNIPHPRSGKVLKPQTLIGKYFQILTLVNYCINTEKSCISEFNKSDVQPFIAFVRERNDKLAANTLAKYLSVIEDLYHYREHLNIALLDHPWPDSSVNYLSGDLKRGDLRGNKQTPCIPDYICSALFQKSVEYIKSNSSRIYEAHSIIEKDLDKRYLDILKKGSKSSFIKTDRKDIHTQYLASRTYGHKQVRVKVLAKYKFKDMRDLSSSIVKARTCCYVMLALTTGMRNSELASLTNESFTRSIGWMMKSIAGSKVTRTN